jgi:hypothetical protein
VVAALLVWLSWADPDNAWAQRTFTGLPPTAVPTFPDIPSNPILLSPGIPTSPPVPAIGVCASDAGDEKGGRAPESPWVKVPHLLSSEGRKGWFLLPPSGKGYYAALDWLRGEARGVTALPQAVWVRCG